MKSPIPKLHALTFAAFLLVCTAPTLAHAQNDTTEQSTQQESAQDQCGFDRRCRIDRLKRLNNLNRRVAILNEEQQISKITDDLHEQHLDNTPRLNKPWGADITTTRLGIGFLGGYNLNGSLRLETSLIIHEDWIYSYDDNDNYIDGYQDGYFLNLSATYFFMPGWFSPYVNAGIVAGWATFSNSGYYYGDWGGGSTDGTGGPPRNENQYAEIHTKYHIVTASAGFDVQLRLGLHARLGLEYGYSLYNQARYSAGNYDADIRKGLGKWMSQFALWGYQFHIGWAF